MAITTNLISYFKCEDATDTLGTNNLTTNGSPTYTTGKLSNAVVVSSGNNLYKEVAAGAILSFTDLATAFSITSWIYRTGATTADGYGTIAGYVGNVSTHRRLFYFATLQTSEYLTMTIGDGAWNRKDTTTAIALNTWTFIAVTYDGTTLKQYVNNTEVYSAAFTMGAGYADGVTGGWGIGAYRQGASSSPFIGRIDSQGVWNKKLTTTELTDLYNAGAGLEYPFTLATPSNGFDDFGGL